jgi:hypothetical protein
MTGVWLAFPGSDVLTFLLTLGLLIPLVRNLKKAASTAEPVPEVGH